MYFQSVNDLYLTQSCALVDRNPSNSLKLSHLLNFIQGIGVAPRVDPSYGGIIGRLEGAAQCNIAQQGRQRQFPPNFALPVPAESPSTLPQATAARSCNDTGPSGAFLLVK